MNNNLTTFYIVRHGETDWNVEKRMQGHSDRLLTLLGKQQAKELSEKLKDVKFDEVFSSDLLRAKETAEIIALEKKMIVKTTQALREKRYGELEGKKWEETQHLYKEWQNLTANEKWTFTAVKDEESNEEAAQRLLLFLRETSIAFPGKTILLVSHGGLIRMLLIKLGAGDFNQVEGLDNCGYVKIASDGIEFFLEEMNGIRTWK